MSDPNIDIIVPNYNKANYLDECIGSVLNQTYVNWSLYIIDDCSTDNSSNILNKYKNEKKIKIIKLKKNKGPSFCRNLGMRLSKAEYISFLDSDDYWTNEKLQIQILYMIKNNLNFTYTDYIPFITKNNQKVYKKETNLKKSFRFDDFIINSSINSSTMIIAKKIIKTKRFRKIGLLEDYLFKCDLLKSNIEAKKIDNSLAYYRILPGNRSSNKVLNLFYLWKINRRYNNLNLYRNLMSIFGIVVNSIKKYGIK
ncbi:MAG: hypothetical protein CMI79_04560 [Candidatus Pelagibacter sp.]|nr:hypothetical protein [Candidatus Pelagibacter sp.]|tara:strand:+ start:10280 stop:11041 length:762 start_codon:yes stop_codon:yes gene_type:complete